MTFKHLLSCLLMLLLFGCPGNDDDIPMPPPPPPPPTDVSFNLAEVPYDNLSDYRFFTGALAEMTPNEGLLEYEPISTLFSDYAHKARYIWMPEGSQATYNGDGSVLEFPEGSVIIKTFFYDNVQPDNNRQIIETRLLYVKNGEWKFADYLWNDEQTEATFDLDGAYRDVRFIDDAGVDRTIEYRIPSEVECLTCHKLNSTAIPIGPKPQNLNDMLSYRDGTQMNQLVKWQSVGYLDPSLDPTTISTTVDWEDTSQDIGLRVRSYLDMNCSSCHRDGGHCDYRSMRFAFSESTTPESLGICVEADEPISSATSTIIRPGNTAKSVLHFRMSTNEAMSRMPLLGRTIVHDEAVLMIEEWITSLTNCN
ncbi:MAG: hypothetical protein AAF433_14895 [Bacteroidota bacterium]